MEWGNFFREGKGGREVWRTKIEREREIERILYISRVYLSGNWKKVERKKNDRKKKTERRVKKA